MTTSKIEFHEHNLKQISGIMLLINKLNKNYGNEKFDSAISELNNKLHYLKFIVDVDLKEAVYKEYLDNKEKLNERI